MLIYSLATELTWRFWAEWSSNQAVFRDHRGIKLWLYLLSTHIIDIWDQVYKALAGSSDGIKSLKIWPTNGIIKEWCVSNRWYACCLLCLHGPDFDSIHSSDPNFIDSHYIGYLDPQKSIRFEIYEFNSQSLTTDPHIPFQKQRTRKQESNPFPNSRPINPKNR